VTRKLLNLDLSEVTVLLLQGTGWQPIDPGSLERVGLFVQATYQGSRIMLRPEAILGVSDRPVANSKENENG